jgi:phospholipase D1/2
MAVSRLLCFLIPRSANNLQVTNFDQYNDFLPKETTKAGHIYNKDMPVEEIHKRLDEIKGHLVWFPLKFLQDAEMAEKGLQINAWTESIYT